MENKKVKRIGTFTLGFCLIVIGITAILSMFIGIKVLKYTLYAWPIIIILIGCEILYYNSKKDITLKYDFWGTVLLIIIFLTAVFGSITSHVVNEFIDNKDYYLEYISDINKSHSTDCIDIDKSI